MLISYINLTLNQRSELHKLANSNLYFDERPGSSNSPYEVKKIKLY